MKKFPIRIDKLAESDVCKNLEQALEEGTWSEVLTPSGAKIGVGMKPTPTPTPTPTPSMVDLSREGEVPEEEEEEDDSSWF